MTKHRRDLLGDPGIGDVGTPIGTGPALVILGAGVVFVAFFFIVGVIATVRQVIAWIA